MAGEPLHHRARRRMPVALLAREGMRVLLRVRVRPIAADFFRRLTRLCRGIGLDCDVVAFKFPNRILELIIGIIAGCHRWIAALRCPIATQRADGW